MTTPKATSKLYQAVFSHLTEYTKDELIELLLTSDFQRWLEEYKSDIDPELIHPLHTVADELSYIILRRFKDTPEPNRIGKYQVSKTRADLASYGRPENNPYHDVVFVLVHPDTGRDIAVRVEYPDEFI